MSNFKILVVDDDPVTRQLLKKRLAKSHYDIETACNGDEALDIISNRLFDIVITDMMMPGTTNGIGVLEAAKDRWKSTEVIVITAYGVVDNAVEAMKKGAADYLEKPINLDELMLKLDKIRNIKSLAKDASDLREAMDITEKNAADTIHNLEFMVSELQHALSAIRKILVDRDLDPLERISQALEIPPRQL